MLISDAQEQNLFDIYIIIVLIFEGKIGKFWYIKLEICIFHIEDMDSTKWKI